MSKNLVIVESPSKANSIQKYLGKDYTVLSSVGHIIDLPSNKLGVDIDDNFKPTFEVIKGKAKVITELKKAAAQSDTVYIASDPDREGEAIAWHISESIKKTNSNIKRVLFNEITKQGVLDGINHPTKINDNRVDAQQSRRILDRLVGYKVSPLLWKPLKYGLSAGRVQSVALRIICEREVDIERFTPVEWWSLDAFLDVFDEKNVKKGQIKAVLDKKDGKKIELSSLEETNVVINDLKNEKFIIDKIDKKKIKTSAPEPFITSKLQQDAIRKLGFTAKKVMSVAQQLYEGVELGKEGPSGLITYLRTDSTRVSAEAVSAAHNYISKNFGNDFIGSPKAPKKQKTTVQDAHEAIRPTDIFRHPDSIKSYLSNDQYRLYKLIWERFIASQMADAIYEQTTAYIKAGVYTFRSGGRVQVFAGFTSLYVEGADDTKNEDNIAFLAVAMNDSCKLIDLKKEQHFTQPPPRFTEASIVQALEQLGIGRPSTYASIISVIVDREYIEIREKRIYPTELGRVVAKLLVANFPNIFDTKFTAEMELELDQIEEGNVNIKEVLTEFYKNFSQELEKAEKKFIVDLHIDMKCPECGKSLTIKYGKNGAFIACTNYPECSFTTDFTRDEAGKISLIDKKSAQSTGLFCEKCGSELHFKKSRYGEIIACSAYPDCKNIKNFVRLGDGSIKLINAGETTGEKCPSCQDGDVVLKSGRNGIFAACSRYPECKFTANIKSDDKGNLIVEAKGKDDKGGALIEDGGVCDKCGKPMVLKKGFRGPFFACSGYPKCKNAKSYKAVIAEMNGEAPAPKSAPKKSVSRKSTAKTVSKAKNAAAKVAAINMSSAKPKKSATTKKSTTKKPVSKSATVDKIEKAPLKKKSATKAVATKKTTVAKKTTTAKKPAAPKKAASKTSGTKSATTKGKTKK